jgi:hypothetical protein
MLALAAVACAGEPAAPPGPGLPLADINNGTPTGPGFGNVGALLFDFNRNNVVDGDDQLCTGTLIAPTVFLTARHCVDFLPPTAQLYVSFEPDLTPAPARFIAATGFTHMQRQGPDQADAEDLGLVFLPAGSTAGITPAGLPPLGYLDQLQAQGGLSKELFINVGYGVAASRTGQPSFAYDGLRKVSRSRFMALQPAWLGLLMNTAATGEGGDCFGDSGGPKFLESNPTIVVATVTTGDRPCRATSWDYRLDTPRARAFLGQYVTLP